MFFTLLHKGEPLFNFFKLNILFVAIPPFSIFKNIMMIVFLYSIRSTSNLIELSVIEILLPLYVVALHFYCFTGS